jgi:nicotinate-nucleotide adenylyltransferase
MVKIGILGGVFDPVHNGHLHIADGVLRTLNLSRVFFIPAGDPPHKDESPVADGTRRMDMLFMAIENNPAFDVLDIEIRREGKSYTVDTLKQLKLEFPEWEIYFIIGGDNLTEIRGWKDPERIFRLSNVVLVNRHGVHKKPSEMDLPGGFIEIELPELNISSTEIREYFKRGIPCRYLMPPGVENYIIENGIYR